MEQKKSKKASDGTVLYIRNLPVPIAEQIRRRAKDKRQSIAGVIIELIEFAGKFNYFDENGH
jgi:hypothetical protein